MEITVDKITPDDPKFPFIWVTVHIHETEVEQPDEKKPLQSVDMKVWIPKTDASLREIEKQAIEKTRELLTAALKALGSS